MKLNKITAYFAAFAALAFSSCSEGKYWDEASNPGEVYAFAKPAETISIPANEAIPTSYSVTISRNVNVGSATVPVEFKSNSDVLTGPSSITFEDGSYSADYVINIATNAKAGIDYSADITLAQPENVITHVKAENLKFALKLSKVLVLEWYDKGVAKTYSLNWVGNEDAVEIPVQQADNYPQDGVYICRLMSPYWYLEPEYATQGANIEFLVDENDNVLGLASSWQLIGEYVDGYGNFFIGCPASQGCSFTNEGDIFTLAGFLAYGTGASPSYYYGAETLKFQWTGYGK